MSWVFNVSKTEKTKEAERSRRQALDRVIDYKRRIVRCMKTMCLFDIMLLTLAWHLRNSP
eukprot:scaffold51973_cov42-Attheya_sp.AAC.2